MKTLKFVFLLIFSLTLNFAYSQRVDFGEQLDKVYRAIEEDRPYMQLFEDVVTLEGAWQDEEVVNLNFELMQRGELRAFELYAANRELIFNGLAKNDYDRFSVLIERSYDVLEAEFVRRGLDPDDLPPVEIERVTLAIYQYLIEDEKTAHFITTVILMNISEEGSWIEGMKYFTQKLYTLDWNVKLPQEGIDDLYQMVIKNSWMLYEEVEDQAEAITYLHEALKLAHRYEETNADGELYDTIGELYMELGNEEQGNYYYELAKKK
jgi:tetratricopeptide (TPR) repeat protein